MLPIRLAWAFPAGRWVSPRKTSTATATPNLVVNYFGGIVLYRNNGDGTFTDTTRTSGLDKDTSWATGVSFGDYDSDGYVDLFVPHYVDFDMKDRPTFGSRKTCQCHDVPVQCGTRGLKGYPDMLFHNNGDGTFTEVATQAGVDEAKRFLGLSSVWSDFDNDGKIDLFVANDGEPNCLYHNEGGGRFRKIGYDAGVAVSDDGVEQTKMGLALGDYMHTERLNVANSIQQIDEVRGKASHAKRCPSSLRPRNRIANRQGRSPLALEALRPSRASNADRFYTLKEGGELKRSKPLNLAVLNLCSSRLTLASVISLPPQRCLRF